jgi:hypothetical protein
MHDQWSDVKPPYRRSMGGSCVILLAMLNTNEFGQPVGNDPGGWVPPPMILDVVPGIADEGADVL